MSIRKFSFRQLPDGVLTSGTVAGPTAWRIDQPFIEAADGFRTFFTLTDPFSAGKLLVFKNGVKMIQGVDIIVHQPTVVEFVIPPLTGAILESTFVVAGSADVALWVVDEQAGGVKNGVNKVFTTFFPYVSQKIMVYKNGLKQIRGVAYNFIELTPTSFQLNLAPLSTDFIEVTYFILT